MGLFGIKTRKEKLAEAEAARKEKELIEEIKHWDRRKCQEALKNKSKYSSKVRRAIEDRERDLFLDARANAKQNKIYDLQRQISAKEAEIRRIENDKSIHWNNSYSDGYRLGYADLTGQINSQKSEVQRLRNEISRLKCQIRDLENNPFI